MLIGSVHTSISGMKVKVREVVTEVLPGYRLRARNIVMSSLLPEEVKQRLLREIYNFFFNVETVADYVASVVEEVEKRSEYEMYFNTYIEVGREFRTCEEMLDAEEFLELLYGVAHEVDKVAMRMYAEIFRKLGYKVSEVPWELKLIIRK